MKNRAEHRVVLPQTLVTFLRRVLGKNKLWQLDDGRGNLCPTAHALTSALMRHLQSLGISGVKATLGFRAGWNTEMFKKGMDLETIWPGAGQKTLAVTMGYLGEPDAHVKEAVRKYDLHFGAKLARSKLMAI